MSALRLGRRTLRKGRTLGRIFHSYAGQRRARPKRPASFYQFLLECNSKAKLEHCVNFRIRCCKGVARFKGFKKTKQSCGVWFNSFQNGVLAIPLSLSLPEPARVSCPATP